MNPLDWLYYAAAGWFMAYAISKTHGPFGMFAWLRSQLPLGGLTACIICLMPYVALLLRLIGANVVIDAFAIAGTALLLHGFTGWRHDF
jgi:hypothetical protein